MTKIEFLEKLRTALANDLTGAVIQENVDYYAGYIRSETEAGRNEEEVIEELGDPWVIAQTIIDTSVPAGANAPYEAEGQAYGHREEEGYCQYSDAREGDLDEKDEDPAPASQEIPGIQED